MTMTDPVADMLTRLRNANSAYHDTVKELAKNRRYRPDVDPRVVPAVEVPYWRRLWEGVRRNLGFA